MPQPPDFPKEPRELSGFLERLGESRLPGFLDIELVELRHGSSQMRMVLAEKHLASNGYLHAASVVALADTAAGYGCVASLPPGAVGFTTIEQKTNHLGTLLSGALVADASLSHEGRSTQVWDTLVTAEETGKTIALYRCTQIILYPNESATS
ncbi:MAG: PaaI family thioesterase [Acidimicrobiia bacterium]